jgi:O-antigen/teichoic acid export membrane protein
LNKPVHHTSSGLTLRANFSWTFVGNAINAASWWAMTIVLAKLGSPEHVGQFALGLATTAPIFMFATLRLRDVQATDTNQEYLFGDYFALRLITTALALLGVIGIVIFSGFSWELSLVILATALSKAIEAISDAFYGLFMQQERLDRIAKSLMIKGPLSLLGLGLGFYLTGTVFWGIIGVCIARAAMTVGYDIRNATLTLNPSANLVSHFIPHAFPGPRWNAEILTRLAWFTLPLGFVTMLISFNANIPRYFIEGQLGVHQLGIFAAITALQKAAPTVVQALGRSASPRLARYYTANNAPAFRKLTLRLIGIGALLGGAGVLVALLLGRPLLTLFYGAEYALPALFVLVMIDAGLDYISTMLLFVITSARYMRIQLPLYLLTTSVVALGCFLLVPSAGLQGAAIAVIISELVRLLGSLAAVWHALRALHRRSSSLELAPSEYAL